MLIEQCTADVNDRGTARNLALRMRLYDCRTARSTEKTMEAMAQKSGAASDQLTIFAMLHLQGHDQARSVRYGAKNVSEMERAVCQLYDEH